MNVRVPTKNCTRWLAASIFVLSVSAVNSGDDTISSGHAKLASCVACHGADGIGKAPQYPNLRGQKAAYLEKQLKAYRSGSREAPDMARMARSLSDEEIAYIAEYFSSMNPNF